MRAMVCTFLHMSIFTVVQYPAVTSSPISATLAVFALITAAIPKPDLQFPTQPPLAPAHLIWTATTAAATNESSSNSTTSTTTTTTQNPPTVQHLAPALALHWIEPNHALALAFLDVEIVVVIIIVQVGGRRGGAAASCPRRRNERQAVRERGVGVREAREEPGGGGGGGRCARGRGQREVVLVAADVAAVEREEDEGDEGVEEGGGEEGEEDGLRMGVVSWLQRCGAAVVDCMTEASQGCALLALQEGDEMTGMTGGRLCPHDAISKWIPCIP